MKKLLLLLLPAVMLTVAATAKRQPTEKDMKATNFVSPKHDSVIQITKKEAKKLEKYWRNKK